ncbi:hypothetical protein B0O80DRAFT_460582 [Mortierella sp. GBAus27b]|nr:hypothetical protein B0O80DRAFT_460582 [Mortierella sp. GBAus27b]
MFHQHHSYGTSLGSASTPSSLTRSNTGLGLTTLIGTTQRTVQPQWLWRGQTFCCITSQDQGFRPSAASQSSHQPLPSQSSSTGSADHVNSGSACWSFRITVEATLASQQETGQTTTSPHFESTGRNHGTTGASSVETTTPVMTAWRAFSFFWRWASRCRSCSLC